MEPQSQQDPFTALLSEFGARLNEIEEKQRLIKDRLLLVGENLISAKEDYDKEISNIKKSIKQSEAEIKTIKQLNQKIVNEIGNFARKAELEILERQMQMFQPLELARIQDVKKIIREEISNLKNKKQENIKPEKYSK